MYIFIGGVDRTANLIDKTIAISDELQERVNSADFSIAGYNPSYFDDVKIWEGFPIVSSTSTTVTLQKSYWTAMQNNIFRVGDIVYVGINLATEESGEIASISENSGNIKLTFVSVFTNTPSAGQLAGRKKFAGNIVDIRDSNNVILENIHFEVRALDYTRIFDKKLLNDTYVNRDARYIVNDFCNITVNKNQTLDQFDYANTTALRVAWIEGGDGGNPTLDTSDFQETDGSGVFDWTFSGGTATFTDTISAVDISSFSGASSGVPSKGRIGLWYKATDYTKITSMVVRVGSDSSNYGSFTITPTTNSWTFHDAKMSTMSITGTPVWTAVDYMALVITETATSSIRIDGIRALESDFFRHYPNVQESIQFADFKMNRVKPTEIMQRIADSLAWYWFIDYNKNIWLFPDTTIIAPISVSETSDNFSSLSISYDTSHLINRQVVRGSEETSDTKYSQVIEGNSIAREWIMKNKFKNLLVKLNDGTSTDLTEAGTNTTTINATAHGLTVGDYIVNRTRGNAVRAVLTTPSLNQFTVATIASQTNGDTFSLFVTQTVGVEGLDVETSYNYMSNFEQKSIKSSSVNTTLPAGSFLLFNYNEVIPILVQRTDNVSVARMKSVLGYTDGVFDGQPLTDQTITSRSEATKTAEGIINKYSNVVITATFSTQQEGIESGQLIHITDTTSSLRNIDQDFIIQSVKLRQLAWGENTYQVTCSSLLFGMLELLQQLLANNRKIKVSSDEVINNIEDSNEDMILTDFALVNINLEDNLETMIIADSASSTQVTPPYYWSAVTGAHPEMRWDFSVWS